MPFPTNEEVRAAVEKELFTALGLGQADWTAVLQDGRELPFCPQREFSLHYYLPDDELANLGEDEPAEKVYLLRLNVQLVHSEPVRPSEPPEESNFRVDR